MAGYTKLFNSILASTIWRADDKTRIVWITLLAMADRNGIAEGSIPGLADMARVSLEDCERALLELESPDKYSRSKENEGRRIRTVDGGWLLLNHPKYREKMSADERREYNRVKQAEWRASQKLSTNVNDSQSQSALSAHTEAAPDTKAKSTERPSGYAVPACFEKVEGFAAALAGWIEHRKKIRKPPTGRAIQLIINRLAEHPERAVKALDTIVEQGWQSFEWHYLDNAKRTNSNQRTDSTRNVGHNANLDYSKRTAAAQARVDREQSEALAEIHRLQAESERNASGGAG